jgi:FixJ family two-component response regulator
MIAGEAPVVMVVDDDPSVRSSMKRLLEVEGFAVRTFDSPEALFTHGRPKLPCCLILDVNLGANDGVNIFERLKQSGMEVPTIFVTGYGDIPMSVRAMKLGAVDFLPKPYDPEQLVACVLNALEKDEQLLSAHKRVTKLREHFDSLTDRQREVFIDVVAGKLNKQVAYDHGITERTVKVHRARVMEKMEAKSFADLVRMAGDLKLARTATSSSVEEVVV